MMIPLASITKDWASFEKTLSPTEYEAVGLKPRGVRGAKSYAAVHISAWNPEIDRGKVNIPIPSSQCERGIGELVKRVAMTGCTIITHDARRNKINKVVIEPGKEWIGFNLASIGADDTDNMRAAILNGPIGSLIGGDPRPLSRKLEREKEKKRSLATDVAYLEDELKSARSEAETVKTALSNANADAISRVKGLESELAKAKQDLRQLKLERMNG